MKLIHSSPLGELEIPTVPEPVPPGTPFDVADDIGASLLQQADLYQPAGTPKPPTIKELRAIAAAAGVDVTGLKKTTEIQAAIDAAVQQQEATA